VEGKKIGELAENTDNLVLTKIDAEQQARQRMGGPVMLRRRGDNSAIVEPAQPVTPPQPYRVSDANGNLILPPRQNNDVSQPVRQGGGLAMPLPDNQQPTTIHQGQTDGGMIMPLPEDQQPNAQQPASQPKPNQGVIDNGVMMPLADDQQPGAQPKTPQPQQNSRQPKQGAIDNGMIMPLPDEQQPNAQQQPAVQQPLTQQPPTSQPYSNRPATTAPAPKQAPVQTPAPRQSQAQPPAQQQQNPPLLLPLPDNQQPGAQQTPQTQSARPQNNTGVYAPPPAGGTNNNSAKPSKKISDTDPAKAKPSTPTSVKKITDQD
jgi:hypothetical protein